MALNNIRDYLFNKLFFPKVVVIDKPGIIYSETSKKYGKTKSKKRQVWFFEDVIAHLQLETAKKFGNKRASEIWYEIGKNIGARLLLFGGPKKVSSFFLPSIINYVFNSLRSGGLSLAETIEFNPANKSLILTGKDNIISRKSNNPHFFAGIVSGILSILLRENIEAEAKYENFLKEYKIIADPLIKTKYVVNQKELIRIKNYENLNFPKMESPQSKFYSFNDLVRFKKILVNKGKFSFLNKIIIPSESGLLSLIIKYFDEMGEIEMIKNGLINSTEKLSADLLKDRIFKNNKVDSIKKIFCALGWGIPYHKIDGENIIFTFLYPPISRYGFLYLSLILNGHLNYIFNKKLKIKKIIIEKKMPKVSITYS